MSNVSRQIIIVHSLFNIPRPNPKILVNQNGVSYISPAAAVLLAVVVVVAAVVAGVGSVGTIMF